MKNNDIEQLKKEYMDISIPKELETVVNNTLKEEKCGKKKISGLGVVAASIAACLVLMVIATNTSQAFAETASNLPIVGDIVKVVTFRQYTVNEKNFNADIKVPAVQGLKNKNLENSLNEKYIAENKKLYESFMADMEEIKKNGEGHVGVSSGYEVKTDNDLILSVERYILTVKGDSNTQKKYDTIDKKRQILITLPSLFKDDSYVDLISKNIISQMKENMKKDSSVIYWIDNNTPYVDSFKKIAKEQNFYINKDSKLVISFNRAEVAPGYVGTVEFVIPTDAISNILVSQEYIK